MGIKTNELINGEETLRKATVQRIFKIENNITSIIRKINNNGNYIGKLENETSSLNLEIDKINIKTKLMNNQLGALAIMVFIQSLIIVGLIISLSVLYTKKINVEIPINKLEFTEITGEEI